MPCSCTLTWKYADEPTQQRASYFYLKGKTTKNAVKLCVAAWLPAKAQVFPEHLLVGGKIVRSERRSDMRLVGQLLLQFLFWN